jgi:hypothetical protein
VRLLGALGLLVGVVAAGWGIWTAFERPRPWLGALVAPLGVALALVGALLLVVPDFFT